MAIFIKTHRSTRRLVRDNFTRFMEARLQLVLVMTAITRSMCACSLVVVVASQATVARLGQCISRCSARRPP